MTEQPEQWTDELEQLRLATLQEALIRRDAADAEALVLAADARAALLAADHCEHTEEHADLLIRARARSELANRLFARRDAYAIVIERLGEQTDESLAALQKPLKDDP